MIYKANILHVLTLVVAMLVLELAHARDASPASIDEAYLFDKGRRVDRIVLRNQIAYHFQQKVIKEVTQELFVSRLIRITPMIRGLDILNATATYLNRFCDGRSSPMWSRADRNSESVSSKAEGYIFVRRGDYSYSEAKAKCQAMGMQLPEVYFEKEAENLAKFMTTVGVELAFAGVEPDSPDMLYKFTSTGMPLWKGWYSHANHTDNPSNSSLISKLVSRFRGHFLYHKEGGLRYRMDGIKPHNLIQIDDFWLNRGKYSTYMVRGVVCQPKWNGKGYEELYVESSRGAASGMSVELSYTPMKHHLDRSKRMIPEVSTGSNNMKYIRESKSNIELGSKGLSDACYSVASHIREAYAETASKLNDLLALVDIKMIVEQQGGSVQRESYGRQKRMGSLIAKVLFKKGTKMLWSLFGFYQQIQTDRKIKKNRQDIDKLKVKTEELDKMASNNRAMAIENRKHILEATNILKEHSIAISELVIATRDLDNRVYAMENKVTELQQEAERLRDEVDTITTLVLIQSLSSRVTMAINNGYDQLADIVHTSLVGQTSPLVLPLAQMQEVQLQLRAMSSSAVLDKDFSKMKSVVTADPQDPELLLVIVNAAALSHVDLELIHIIPVPYYDKSRAYTPIIEYQYAALNQPQNAFTVLTDDEAEDCIERRCYISQMEQSMFSQTCGMPQFANNHVDACDMDSVPHDGMHIQAANPDGVIFSFRDNTTVQIFCKENKYIGAAKEIKGAGVMYVPPGCTLHATNSKGVTVKAKGGPSHHLIEITEIDLARDNILSFPTKEVSEVEGPKRPAAETALEQQLTIVQESMDSAHKNVSQLQKTLWITAGCIISVVVIVIVAVMLLYRYSRRFKHRFNKAVGTMAVLRERLLDIEKIKSTVSSFAPRALTRFRPTAVPRLSLDNDNDYIHLTSQIEENARGTRESRDRRVYARLPMTRSTNALLSPDLPFRQTVAPRTHLRTLRESRVYPDVPPKETSSEEELAEQCRSLDELSMVTHGMLKNDAQERAVSFSDSAGRK